MPRAGLSIHIARNVTRIELICISLRLKNARRLQTLFKFITTCKTAMRSIRIWICICLVNAGRLRLLPAAVSIRMRVIRKNIWKPGGVCIECVGTHIKRRSIWSPIPIVPVGSIRQKLDVLQNPVSNFWLTENDWIYYFNFENFEELNELWKCTRHSGDTVGFVGRKRKALSPSAQLGMNQCLQTLTWIR